MDQFDDWTPRAALPRGFPGDELRRRARDPARGAGPRFSTSRHITRCGRTTIRESKAAPKLKELVNSMGELNSLGGFSSSLAGDGPRHREATTPIDMTLHSPRAGVRNRLLPVGEAVPKQRTLDKAAPPARGGTRLAYVVLTRAGKRLRAVQCGPRLTTASGIGDPSRSSTGGGVEVKDTGSAMALWLCGAVGALHTRDPFDRFTRPPAAARPASLDPQIGRPVTIDGDFVPLVDDAAAEYDVERAVFHLNSAMAGSSRSKATS